MHIVGRKCEQKNYTLEDREKMCFFGIYENDPTHFRFSDYEKDLIEKFVQHVRQILLNGPGPDHFYKTDNVNSQFRSNHWFFKTETTQSRPQQLPQAPTRTHTFLNLLLETANRNANKAKGGFRFEEKLTKYASYFCLLAGPLAYETLQKNLPHALPSLSAVNRFVARTHHSIIEGQLRCNDLYAYLNERALPLAVAISQAESRVINRPQYDKNTNQIIGFVLPTDHNGLPIPFTYKARSAEEIMEHFASEANFINTVMAQPLDNALAFCLLVHGSNSKYTAEQTSKRWKFETAELLKLNIENLTVSSDSDPKLNSATKKNSLLGETSNVLLDIEWFKCCNNCNGPFYFQDTPHIGTKLRNFLLKTKGNEKKLPLNK